MTIYKQALEIDESLGDMPGKATTLNNIATIQFKQGHYEEAIHNFENALQILIELGLESSANAQTFRKNIEYAKQKLNEC